MKAKSVSNGSYLSVESRHPKAGSNVNKNLYSKILLLTLLLWGQPNLAPAQLHVTGGILIISPGATLHSNGNVTNTAGGQLTNEGTLDITGSIANSAGATLQGDGRYALSGNWTNSAHFVAGASAVSFQGASNSAVASGNAPFFIVETAKTNADVLLADGMTILRALHFTADHNRVHILANDLILGPIGEIRNFDENNYILTGGEGKLVKSELSVTPFTFPVGFDAATYNPMILSQHGGAEAVGVRCLEHIFETGGSGSPFTSGATDVSWEITETIPGDNDMDMTVFWNIADELPSFNRSECSVGFWNGSLWNFGLSPGGPAGGANPYFSAGLSAVSDPGIFGVRSFQGAGLKIKTPIPVAEPEEMLVYPNPFSTKLTVLNATREIQVFNLAGQLVVQFDLGDGQNPSPPAELDLRHLPAGAYLLKTTGPDGQPVSLKVVRADR